MMFLLLVNWFAHFAQTFGQITPSEQILTNSMKNKIARNLL